MIRFGTTTTPRDTPVSGFLHNRAARHPSPSNTQWAGWAARPPVRNPDVFPPLARLAHASVLPFLYELSLLVAYESAFSRIAWSLRTQGGDPWRVKLALALVLRGRPRYAANFVGGWIEEAAAAGSFRGARRVVKAYKASLANKEKAAREARDRLDEYAGVRGTDRQGLQLDRREFVETKKALLSLATAQMGWYRNPGNRYRADLLDFFVPVLTRPELPEEHGIVMRVARDGQAWYAWRRTVTGWCFAIGASSPPPDQWEFDGPEPPEGFPGQDPAWGAGPFGSAANPNWEEPTAEPRSGE